MHGLRNLVGRFKVTVLFSAPNKMSNMREKVEAFVATGNFRWNLRKGAQLNTRGFFYLVNYNWTSVATAFFMRAF